MNALSTYLWKEWREQRATLALLAAALCVGVGAVVATLPCAAASDALTFQCVVTGALAAALLSVGADLLSRERERGLRFLERHPAGLGTAFRAKLVFLFGVLVAALAFGAALATAAALLRGGALPEVEPGPDVVQYAGLLVVLSLWTFAVSAWMPSSALTLPATALLLVGLGWPALPVLLRQPGFQPTDTQVWSFAALCVVGAPASAWAAFVAASRGGGTRRRAALAGLAVAALAFAPSWAWAAARFHAARHTPHELGAAWVGADGRYAFVNAMRPTALGEEDRLDTALRVDLRDGSWSYLGERDASALQVPEDERRVRIQPESPRSEPLVLVDWRGTLWRESLLDPLRGEEPSEPDPLPLAVTPVDFGLQTAPRNWWVTRMGSGMRLQYHEEGSRTPRMRYLAPDGRVVADDELPRHDNGMAISMLLVRPGRWLALRGARGWCLFDPEAGTVEPLEGLSPKEWLGPLLDDGRALLVAGERLLVLDLDSGVRTPVETTGADLPRVRSVSATGGSFACVPADGPTLVVVMDGSTSRLGWLDARAATMHVGPSCGELHLQVLWSDGPRAIVREGFQRLALHDVETGERRVLLDASELDG